MNAEEIKIAPIEDVIRVWGIEPFYDPRDGQKKIIVRRGKDLPEGGMSVIAARRPEIINWLEADQARKDEERRERADPSGRAERV